MPLTCDPPPMTCETLTPKVKFPRPGSGTDVMERRLLGPDVEITVA